jgi:hypothetical protein
MMKVTVKTLENTTKWARNEGTARKDKQLVIDGLIADGVKPDDLLAPAKGGENLTFVQMKDAVKAGMPAEARALMNAEVKALTDASKAKRKYYQQQIGSLMKDLRKALNSRLAKKEKGARSGATVEARALEALAAWKKKFQAQEAPSVDVTKLIKALDSAMALLVVTAPEAKAKKK